MYFLMFELLLEIQKNHRMSVTIFFIFCLIAVCQSFEKQRVKEGKYLFRNQIDNQFF